MKKTYLIFFLIVSGSLVTKAQLTPFFTNSIENGFIDYATDRLVINDVMFLPLEEEEPVGKTYFKGSASKLVPGMLIRQTK